MAGLCRVLIAATLVIHLLVGCCSHHAHACDNKDCPSPTHSDATHDGQCSDSGSDHSHHGPQDCEGTKCSFVSPSRSVSDSFVLPLQPFFAAMLDNQLPQVGAGREHYSLASGRLQLPVRLHLAYQVLLI